MFKTKNSKSLEKRLQVAKVMPCGLHSTIRRTLLCSRLMGLFPLSGLSHPAGDQLRFTLWSPYSLFYFVSMIGQCLMFVMSFYWLLERGISLTNITNSCFYSSSMVSSIILLNIGRFWPVVVKKAEEIEVHLPPFSRDVAKICNMTMVGILLAALVEHILSIIYGLAVANSCAADSIGETFFRFNMPWIFDYTPFTIWKGILIEGVMNTHPAFLVYVLLWVTTEPYSMRGLTCTWPVIIANIIFNIQSTFIWSFNDLLVIVISIYLTEHLIVHNDLLQQAVRQDSFSAHIFRVQYLMIVRLVKLINKQVGIYILTSFGSNLYFICTQFFYSLNKTQTGHFIACRDKNPKDYGTLHGIEHTVYFTYSFSFLVVRTMLVLLLAARINSNSRLPLVSLYSLPSEHFNVEVERFIAQINDIKVALSGLDFFYVTRTMILTVSSSFSLGKSYLLNLTQ